MLFVSGKSPHLSITQSVYDFFIERYEIASDVEVYHTNLSNKNAVGFTEMNGDEQFIQVHNKLNKEDFIVSPRCLFSRGALFLSRFSRGRSSQRGLCVVSLASFPNQTLSNSEEEEKILFVFFSRDKSVAHVSPFVVHSFFLFVSFSRRFCRARSFSLSLSLSLRARVSGDAAKVTFVKSLPHPRHI